MGMGKAKFVQAAAGLALVTCLLCPLFEILLHSDGSIFVSGHDMESTLALVLIVIELSLAVARLLALVLAVIFLQLGIVVSSRVFSEGEACSAITASPSPPIFLRI
jgi:hypothetical protein